MRTSGRFVLAVLSLYACSDSSNPAASANHRGTLVISSSADPQTLFPPLITDVQGRQIAEQIYDYLAVVGPQLNTYGDKGFEPRLARSWSWSPDSMSIAFHIDPRARWHDGVKADAADVRFTFQVYTNAKLASPDAEELKNVDSVTTRDSATAMFWYHARSPHQLLDATMMLILPRHLLGKVPIDSLHQLAAVAQPIGTGRFRFGPWKRRTFVELRADTANYRGRPGVDRLIWTNVPTPAVAIMKLLAGELDVYPAVRADHLAELARHRNVRVLSQPATDYVFFAFNLRRPIFASRELRRALTMAVDRENVVRNVFDTLARTAIGPTVRVFPTTDTSALAQIPFDVTRANRTLDSLGWKTTASGTRKRANAELAFAAIVPNSSAARMKMAVLLQEQLRRVGVRMSIDQMDFSTFSARLTSRDFDAAFSSFTLGATADALRETWGSAAARQGGRNEGGYVSFIFDAEVDSAISSLTLESSKKHFTRAYQTIIADAPAIWLYEPKTVIGLHRRITVSAMRADSWWFDLGSWYIPASEEIPRDRIR